MNLCPTEIQGIKRHPGKRGEVGDLRLVQIQNLQRHPGKG